MKKNPNKVRRLIDYESPAQYKKIKAIAKNKGFKTIKKFVEHILQSEVINYDNKQLELFKSEKNEKKQQ